ncbi:hypothetical protein [Cyanobium sp. CH-040]|uniref:hypothetical protein n=1 Tax=Cyanobium sp. CH-040 TaxID=2823708 RepID=UPI0020CBAC6A|nr:hypothetical protein [Cyanobium sp. CH-040]MCP9926692.1 hypothetical protein [Cyanobium sp. CH-040]
MPAVLAEVAAGAVMVFVALLRSCSSLTMFCLLFWVMDWMLVDAFSVVIVAPAMHSSGGSGLGFQM